MLSNIFQKIKEYDQIIIHRHIRPDGDCIGSQFGLKNIIQTTYPEKKVYCVGDEIPDYLSFIGNNDIVTDDMYKDSLVIVVDTSVSDRICDSRYKTGAYLVKIDHHDDSESYGDIEYVDASSPACSSIIACYVKNHQNELKMTEEGAISLFTGIVTDTGRFQYRGVNESVMVSAGYLLTYDFNTEDIYTKLYLKEKESLLLEGYVLSHLKFTKNGVAYFFFTNEIIEKFKVSKEDAAALVNSYSMINGSLIWVTFVDYKENIRVRIRSRYVAINDVAKNYRGGGHTLASGATIYNEQEKKAILKELDKVLKEFKKLHPECK